MGESAKTNRRPRCETPSRGFLPGKKDAARAKVLEGIPPIPVPALIKPEVVLFCLTFPHLPRLAPCPPPFLFVPRQKARRLPTASPSPPSSWPTQSGNVLVCLVRAPLVPALLGPAPLVPAPHSLRPFPAYYTTPLNGKNPSRYLCGSRPLKGPPSGRVPHLAGV